MKRLYHHWIRKRRWGFVGQELRKDEWVERRVVEVIEVELTGRKGRGRQRLRKFEWVLIDWVSEVKNSLAI